MYKILRRLHQISTTAKKMLGLQLTVFVVNSGKRMTLSDLMLDVVSLKQGLIAGLDDSLPTDHWLNRGQTR
jgi:hypothetical protein